jgi:ferredoxin-thioredoxin reductase catalytic subunit
MRVKTNPDKEFVKEIKDKLKQNGGYCPCRISKTPDTKCRCKEFREMVERGETGMCHSGLFVIEEDK